MMHRHDFRRTDRLPFTASASIIIGLSGLLWAAIGLAVWGAM